jgi:hypothetical protein
MHFDKRGKQSLLVMLLAYWLIQVDKQKFNKTTKKLYSSL